MGAEFKKTCGSLLNQLETLNKQLLSHKDTPDVQDNLEAIASFAKERLYETWRTLNTRLLKIAANAYNEGKVDLAILLGSLNTSHYYGTFVAATRAISSSYKSGQLPAAEAQKMIQQRLDTLKEITKGLTAIESVRLKLSSGDSYIIHIPGLTSVELFPLELVSFEEGIRGISLETLKRIILAVIYSHHEMGNLIGGLDANLENYCIMREAASQSAENITQHHNSFWQTITKFNKLYSEVRKFYKTSEYSSEIKNLEESWFASLKVAREEFMKLREEADGIMPSSESSEIEETRAAISGGYSTIIENLNIFIAYAKTGELKVRQKNLNISAFLKAEIEYLNIAGRAELSFQLAEPDIIINTDSRLLTLAVRNIYQNAIDAGADNFEVNTKIEGDYVIIKFSDTGKGIAVEDIPRIFDFLWTKGKKQGTGAGLALAQAAVTQLGGKIEVQSEVGKGMTFTVQLPLKESPDKAGGWGGT